MDNSIRVTLKTIDHFAGSPDLRSELIRRLIESEQPVPIEELVYIDGSSAVVIDSLLQLHDGSPLPRKGRCLDLTICVDLTFTADDMAALGAGDYFRR